MILVFLIAYLFFFVGLLLVFLFFRSLYLTFSRWRDRKERLKNINDLIDLIPMLCVGVFVTSFISQLLMWAHGPLRPTPFFNYPESNHGEIHYVNGSLRHWLWIIIFCSGAAFMLPVILVRVIGLVRKKADSKR